MFKKTNEQVRQSSIEPEEDGHHFLGLFSIEPERKLVYQYGKSFNNKLCSFSRIPTLSSTTSSLLSSSNLYNQTLTLFRIVCFAYLISEAAFCLPQNSLPTAKSTLAQIQPNAVKTTTLMMNKVFQNSSDLRSKTESLTLSLPFNGQSMAVFRSKRNAPDSEETSNIKPESRIDLER